MDTELKPGIYLIVEFNWPRPFEPAHAKLARALHNAVQEAGWIQGIAAASGGIGAGPASVWIFRMEDYGAIDRLLRMPGDPVCDAYIAFITQMQDVEDRVREEVIFL